MTIEVAIRTHNGCLDPVMPPDDLVLHWLFTPGDADLVDYQGAALCGEKPDGEWDTDIDWPIGCPNWCRGCTARLASAVQP